MPIFRTKGRIGTSAKGTDTASNAHILIANNKWVRKMYNGSTLVYDTTQWDFYPIKAAMEVPASNSTKQVVFTIVSAIEKQPSSYIIVDSKSSNITKVEITQKTGYFYYVTATLSTTTTGNIYTIQLHNEKNAIIQLYACCAQHIHSQNSLIPYYLNFTGFSGSDYEYYFVSSNAVNLSNNEIKQLVYLNPKAQSYNLSLIAQNGVGYNSNLSMAQFTNVSNKNVLPIVAIKADSTTTKDQACPSNVMQCHSSYGITYSSSQYTYLFVVRKSISSGLMDVVGYFQPGDLGSWSEYDHGPYYLTVKLNSVSGGNIANERGYYTST